MRSKSGRLKAKRRTLLHIISSVITVSVCTLFLLSCGKAPQEQEAGGYLYVPEQVEGVLPEGDPEEQQAVQYRFLAKDGYLYYMTDGIYRVPIGDSLDFAAKEMVASGDSLLESEPGEAADFTIDRNRNLYYIAFSYRDMVPVLHKRTGAGEEVYRISLEEEKTSYGQHSMIAVDGEENLYALLSDSILRFDPEGNPTGKLSLEEEIAGSALVNNYLMEIPEGNVFFFTENNADGSRGAYEILEGDIPRLREVEGLSQALLKSSPYPGVEGVLLNSSDGGLYRYDLAEDVTEKVLSWQDSDLFRLDIDAVIQISEGQLLVLERTGESVGRQELLLLTKTPEEQVPQKEIITLASLAPSAELQKAAVRFSRGSRRYHVTIERYGATGIYGESEGAGARLDSALASKKDAPDLLDMSGLDVFKYVEAGALEDLYPYMEQGGQLVREDFLGNLLEGYTFDGKLAGIPRAFYFLGAFITDERVLEAEEWTMESVMETADRYPDVRLFPENQNMLEMYFGSCILEKFVDWESGECHFDSDGFCRLLERVKQEMAWDGTGKEAWLDVRYVPSFLDYQQMMTEYGENVVFRGLPSADGREVLEVRVKDVLGMTVNSGHKEGAWEFLQFFLQEGYNREFSYEFPTLLSLLDQIEEDCLTPNYLLDEDGEVWLDKDGQPREEPKMIWYRNGAEMILYAMEQSEADALRGRIEQIDFRPRSALEQSVLSIVQEEAEPFIRGEKTAAEAVDVMQNRVGLLLKENR